METQVFSFIFHRNKNNAYNETILLGGFKMGDYNTYRGRIISPTEEALSMYRYWEEKYLIFMMSSVDGDKRISVHRWFAAKPCPGEYIHGDAH